MTREPEVKELVNTRLASDTANGISVKEYLYFCCNKFRA